MSCIFCQIIKKKSPADIVYEDKKIIAFKSINPKMPVHILIVPRKHISSLQKMQKKDAKLFQEMIWRAKLLAKKFNIDKTGYKLILNCGRGGGQVINHIHLHLLGGGDFTKWLI